MIVWKIKNPEKAPPTMVPHTLGERGGGHGYSFGNVNGDGHDDVLTAAGWYEHPGDDPWAGPWKLHPETAVAYKASCPPTRSAAFPAIGAGRSTAGRSITPARTIDGYPQGYAIHVVEEDRIDTFYRPLLASGERVILVYEPDRRRAAKMRLPARVKVRGQVLELQGKASRVMVRLGDEEIEAKTVHRRFWADFQTTMMLKQLEDIGDTLTVTADFPDGNYAVRPGTERDWTVRKCSARWE